VHESIGFIKLGPLDKRSTAQTDYIEPVSGILIVDADLLIDGSRRFQPAGTAVAQRRQRINPGEVTVYRPTSPQIRCGVA
jgi:hypothetical protein